jgi:hypothetical protein
MMRVRLKADGRIVELLPDGSEKTVDHSDPASFVRQVRNRYGPRKPNLPRRSKCRSKPCATGSRASAPRAAPRAHCSS